MLYQAHRGVSSDFPENTMPAFRGAADQGYQYIETDPTITADGVCILFHDKTLARTCRNPDGSRVADRKITELTYAETQLLDAGIAKGIQFAGTKIPTLSELLAFAKEKNITVKLDNKIWAFSDGQLETLYTAVERSGAKVGFSCGSFASLRRVLTRFPRAEIHYDGPVDRETLEQLKATVGENPLFLWLALANENTAWVKIPRADPALCALAKQYGKLGIWIIDREEELREAVALGADIIETTGSLKPLN